MPINKVNYFTHIHLFLHQHNPSSSSPLILSVLKSSTVKIDYHKFPHNISNQSLGIKAVDSYAFTPNYILAVPFMNEAESFFWIAFPFMM